MATLSDIKSVHQNGLQSDARSYGPRGFRILDSGGGGSAGEYYYGIHVLAEAVVSAENELGGDDLDTDTLPAGIFIPGVFMQDNITVASGTILCYLTDAVS